MERTRKNVKILIDKFHTGYINSRIDRTVGFTAAQDWGKDIFPTDDIELIIKWYQLNWSDAMYLNKVIKDFTKA